MGVYYSDNIKQVYAPNVTKSSSRYDTKIRLVNTKGETSVRFIRSRDLTFNNEDSTVHVVTPVESCRPDLIAYRYYGNTKYAWVILSANNFHLPYELVTGTKILIPSALSLQGGAGKLVTR